VRCTFRGPYSGASATTTAEGKFLHKVSHKFLRFLSFYPKLLPFSATIFNYRSVMTLITLALCLVNLSHLHSPFPFDHSNEYSVFTISIIRRPWINHGRLWRWRADYWYSIRRARFKFPLKMSRSFQTNRCILSATYCRFPGTLFPVYGNNIFSCISLQFSTLFQCREAVIVGERASLPLYRRPWCVMSDFLRELP
jgi:hypothetical protein